MGVLLDDDRYSRFLADARLVSDEAVYSGKRLPELERLLKWTEHHHLIVPMVSATQA